MFEVIHRHSALFLALCIGAVSTVAMLALEKDSSLLRASITGITESDFAGTALPTGKVPSWADLLPEEYDHVVAGTLAEEKQIELPSYDPALFGISLNDLGDTKIERELKNTLLTYSVPYMGSYHVDSKEYDGSHLAVDIRLPTGTPIHSVADGRVIDVKWDSAGYGNLVVIRHDDVPLITGGTETIFSGYAHLDDIIVSKNAEVVRGEKVGYSGNTGASSGPHLHLQIDTDAAPWHPWWPYSSSDTNALGVGFSEGINLGLGKEDAIEFTINPMLWAQRYAVVPGGELALLTAGELEEVEEHSHDDAHTHEEENAEEVESTEDVQENEEVESAEEESLAGEEEITTEEIIAQEETVEQTEEVEESVEENTEEAEEEVESSSGPFSDVPASHPFAESISALKERGVIGGYPDGTFGPEKTVSRVEAVKIILGGLDIAERDLGLDFPDTDEDAWYAPFVSTAVSKDIVGGYPDGTFKPGQAVNRAEWWVILLGAARVDPISVKIDPAEDVPAGSWFADEAAYALRNDLMPNVKNGFLPSAGMTRGEVAESLYLLLESL